MRKLSPLLGMLMVLLVLPALASAAWVDTDYVYRSSVNITEVNGQNYNLLTTPITTINVSSLYAQGKIGANCEGLFFTDDNDNVLPFCVGYPFCWTDNFGCNTTMGASNPYFYVMGNITSLSTHPWKVYYNTSGDFNNSIEDSWYLYQNDTTYEAAKWEKVGQASGPTAGVGFLLNSTATNQLTFVKSVPTLPTTYCLDYRVSITGGAGIIHTGSVVNDSSYAGGDYASFVVVDKLYSKWDIANGQIIYIYFNTTDDEVVWDTITGITNSTSYIEEICKNETHYFYRLYDSAYTLVDSATPVAVSSVRTGEEVLFLGDPLTEAWRGNSTASNLTVGVYSEPAPTVSALYGEGISPDWGDISNIAWNATVNYRDDWYLFWDSSAAKNVSLIRFFFAGNGSIAKSVSFTEDSAQNSHLFFVNTSNITEGKAHYLVVAGGVQNLTPGDYRFDLTTATGWFNSTTSCFNDAIDNCTYAVASWYNISTNQTFTVNPPPLPFSTSYDDSQCDVSGWQIDLGTTQGTSYANLSVSAPYGSTFTSEMNGTGVTQWTFTIPALNQDPNRIFRVPGNYTFTTFVCGDYCNSTTGYIIVNSDYCGPLASSGDDIAGFFGVPSNMGLELLAWIVTVFMAALISVISRTWQLGALTFLGCLLFFSTLGWVAWWVTALMVIVGGFVITREFLGDIY